MPSLQQSTQVATRTSEIYSLMVNGVTERQKIYKYMDSQNWGLSQAQKDRYIGKARAMLKDSLEKTQEECLALATRRLEDLYSKFNAAKDYAGALNVLREYIRLRCSTATASAADTGITINIVKVDSGLPAPQEPEPVEVIDVNPEPAEEEEN